MTCRARPQRATSILRPRRVIATAIRPGAARSPLGPVGCHFIKWRGSRFARSAPESSNFTPPTTSSRGGPAVSVNGSIEPAREGDRERVQSGLPVLVAQVLGELGLKRQYGGCIEVSAVRRSPAASSRASNSWRLRSLPGAIASMFMSITVPIPGPAVSPTSISTMTTRAAGIIASRTLRRIRTQDSSSQSCKMYLSRYMCAVGTESKKSPRRSSSCGSPTRAAQHQPGLRAAW